MAITWQWYTWARQNGLCWIRFVFQWQRQKYNNTKCVCVYISGKNRGLIKLFSLPKQIGFLC